MLDTYYLVVPNFVTFSLTKFRGKFRAKFDQLCKIFVVFVVSKLKKLRTFRMVPLQKLSLSDAVMKD